MSRRYASLVTAAILMVALLSVAFLLPVPYVTMRPGPTFNTLGTYDKKPIIEFGNGVKTYKTSGSLRLTTVSVTRADSRISLTQAFRAYLDPDEAVVPRDVIYPQGQTVQQATQATTAQMAGSKQTSEVAALRLAGYKVPSAVRAVSVEKGGAADGILEAGDTIAAVDGESVTEPDQAVKQISVVKPGTTLTLTIKRDGKEQAVEVKTGANPDDKNKSLVGVQIGSDYSFPFTVKNNVGEDIGGPSAGTMFALAIYDRLTPGALTGGKAVAGTGEIEADGKVDPIGGIQQKIAGAAEAKANIFLVPADNCAEAKSGDDFGLKLVRITNLKEAVTSLTTLAADPDAKVASCN